MTILITGGSGRLGRELVKYRPNCIHPTHQELDVTNCSNVRHFIKEIKPKIIIHCAALTGIRQCEENKHLAWNTNAEGTRYLLEACLGYAPFCYFIYISTPCVFYGDKGDYTEKDIPYPKNFYGLTKLLGELSVCWSGLQKWLIIRTNFVAREKWDYPKAFIDRFGTYLFADDAAQASCKVLDAEMEGVVHICGKEKISMLDLARITTPEVQPMTLADYRGPPLTQDMSLRSSRIAPFEITRKPTT